VTSAAVRVTAALVGGGEVAGVVAAEPLETGVPEPHAVTTSAAIHAFIAARYTDGARP
jgi:hypothetical protein